MLVMTKAPEVMEQEVPMVQPKMAEEADFRADKRRKTRKCQDGGVRR